MTFYSQFNKKINNSKFSSKFLYTNKILLIFFEIWLENFDKLYLKFLYIQKNVTKITRNLNKIKFLQSFCNFFLRIFSLSSLKFHLIYSRISSKLHKNFYHNLIKFEVFRLDKGIFHTFVGQMAWNVSEVFSEFTIKSLQHLSA